MIKCELWGCANDADVILRADDPQWHTRRSGVYLLCTKHYNDLDVMKDCWPIKVGDEDFLPTLAILAILAMLEL